MPPWYSDLPHRLFLLRAHNWRGIVVRKQTPPQLPATGETDAPKTETDAENLCACNSSGFAAEKVLFRVMMCISRVTFVLWPTTFSGGGRLTRYFYSLGGTVAFFGVLVLVGQRVNNLKTMKTSEKPP